MLAPNRRLRLILVFVSGLALTAALGACPPEDDDDADTTITDDVGDASDASDVEGALQWYTTCGDPVCAGYTPPNPPLPKCDDLGVAEGEACATADDRCDPMSDCNALLMCTDTDPKTGPGGCPISRRAFKRDIHYLSDAERQALARDLLAMPLARWRYRHEGPQAPERLGFVLEDVEPSPAADSPRDRVDLYGYATMAVATVQAQQEEIDRLRAEVRALRDSVQALRQMVGAPATP